VSPKPQDNATARLGKAPRVLPLPRTCFTLWAKEDLTHDRAGAGGGEELGGLRGMSLYLQRVALQGYRAVVEQLVGAKGVTA